MSDSIEAEVHQRLVRDRKREQTRDPKEVKELKEYHEKLLTGEPLSDRQLVRIRMLLGDIVNKLRTEETK